MVLLNKSNIIKSENFYKYKPIDNIILKKKNKELLFYYLSNNNNVVFFKIIITGKEKTEYDLNHAFYNLGVVNIEPDYKKINILTDGSIDDKIRGKEFWRKIYSRNEHDTFTTFKLISRQIEAKLLIEEMVIAVLTPDNKIKIRRVEAVASLEPNIDILEVCWNGIVTERYFTRLGKTIIQTFIFSTDAALVQYEFKLEELEIQDIISYQCLPRGRGSAMLATDIRDEKILVIFSKHPGNLGQVEGQFLAKFEVDQDVDID